VQVESRPFFFTTRAPSPPFSVTHFLLGVFLLILLYSVLPPFIFPPLLSPQLCLGRFPAAHLPEATGPFPLHPRRTHPCPRLIFLILKFLRGSKLGLFLFLYTEKRLCCGVTLTSSRDRRSFVSTPSSSFSPSLERHTFISENSF